MTKQQKITKDIRDSQNSGENLVKFAKYVEEKNNQARKRVDDLKGAVAVANQSVYLMDSAEKAKKDHANIVAKKAGHIMSQEVEEKAIFENEWTPWHQYQALEKKMGEILDIDPLTSTPTVVEGTEGAHEVAAQPVPSVYIAPFRDGISMADSARRAAENARSL